MSFHVAARAIGGAVHDRVARLPPPYGGSGGIDPTSAGSVATGDEQIGQPEQHTDALRVLRQSPIAHLRVVEVALHVQERMFDLRPHRRLAPLRGLLRARLVQPPTLAELHRNLPIHIRVPVLLALAHPLVARVAPHPLLAPVQQRVRRRHVRLVRRRRLHAVRQARLRVHTAPGPTERAAYYRWLFFAAGPLEAAVTNNRLGFEVPADKRSMVGYGHYELVMDVLEKAVPTSGHIAGTAFTAADVYVGSQIGWGLQFGSIEKRDGFARYWERVSERKAYRRATDLDNALIPG